MSEIPFSHAAKAMVDSLLSRLHRHRDFALANVRGGITMFPNASSTLLLTLISLAAPYVMAADSCQPVFDALRKVATTPSHSYTINSTVNGGKAEGETIFVNGKKYIRARGKWMHLPVTSQDVLEQEKEKEEKGKSACQLLRRESVNDEAAILYSMHREYGDLKEDGQMWISTSTGLPLRVEEDVDNRGNKRNEHQSTRFDYSNIRPPM
jgi:hypothetical protein